MIYQVMAQPVDVVEVFIEAVSFILIGDESFIAVGSSFSESIAQSCGGVFVGQ